MIIELMTVTVAELRGITDADFDVCLVAIAG
jgi:hypothetical protein